MVLNHLNLTVTDVQKAKAFLIKYFKLKDIGGNNKMAFLQDDNDLVLSLMIPGKEKDVTYPETFHIGFIVESRQKVNEINEILKSDGYDVPQPKKYHAWTFYLLAPGGFTIEVMSAN